MFRARARRDTDVAHGFAWNRFALVLTFLTGCGDSRPDPDPPPRAVVPAYRGEHPPAPEEYLAHRTVDSIAIDGSLQETSWAEAKWTRPFVDIEGPRRPTPAWETRVKMVWDDRALYVAAKLEEPHLWGTITERDAVIFHDNDFEIFLDPDGDSHRYYELEINALGTVWDLFLDKPYRDGGTALNEWDIAGLETAVALDGTINDPADRDRGWTVEVLIPWSALPDRPGGGSGDPPTDGEQWRVNFSRVQWQLDVADTGYRKRTDSSGNPRAEDNWVWSAQDAINMHMPEMWGIVQFSDTPAAQGSLAVSQIEGAAAAWLLRRLYYDQRAYLLERGSYGSMAEIGWDPGEVRLVLDDSATAFRALVTDGAMTWSIDNDGRLLHRPASEERQ